MADYKTGTRNIQNEPGASCSARKWEIDLKNENKQRNKNQQCGSEMLKGLRMLLKELPVVKVKAMWARK
jgi:PHP family Zn ribbon phosphoesterase